MTEYDVRDEFAHEMSQFDGSTDKEIGIMTGGGFFGGLAALANIGGGRDTYTTTSTGGAATVALVVVLGVLLVSLVYVGLGGGKGKR